MGGDLLLLFLVESRPVVLHPQQVADVVLVQEDPRARGGGVLAHVGQCFEGQPVQSHPHVGVGLLVDAGLQDTLHPRLLLQPVHAPLQRCDEAFSLERRGAELERERTQPVPRFLDCVLDPADLVTSPIDKRRSPKDVEPGGGRGQHLDRIVVKVRRQSSPLAFLGLHQQVQESPAFFLRTPQGHDRSPQLVLCGDAFGHVPRHHLHRDDL